MRSFLHPTSQRVLASPTSFSCLIASCRCVFTRESWTPVTLQPNGAATAATPLPARLLWQYRSSTPRHLTLCLRRPATTSSTAAAAASGGDDAQESGDAQGRSFAVESGNLEDYVYGRLFLRPYNVAQLLTVLQGWSEGPAVVERARASLQLTPVSESSNPNSVPTAVKLTARLTRKGVPPPASASSQSTAAGSACATPNTDVDPSASEDYPGSFYLDDQVGTVTTVLRNEDLVFLTNHLESVLSDFFSMEHQTIRDAVRRGVDRQSSFPARRASAHPPGRHASASQTPRVSSAVPPPQQPQRSHRYLSDRYTASRSTFASEKAPAAAASLSTQAAAPAARAALSQTTISMDELLDAEDVAGETVENVAEDVWESPHTAEAETVRISAAAAASEAAASSSLAATAEIEDEYEEVVEEVEMEEAEEIEDASAAAATSPTSDAATPHSAADAFDLDASAAIPQATPVSPPSVSYHASHVRDSGTATIESDNRYVTGRFVRDGSATAAEVAEVSRIGDFDVVRRTQQAQGATETDGAHTTVSATQTSGAFRSASGDVRGTFSYERVAVATSSSSVAPAAAAAAASAIPVRRPDAAAEDAAADEGGDEEGPTMVVPAKSVKAVASEQTEEAATAAAQPAKEAAKRKRASAKSGAKKKSSTNKKKKATRRTAAAKDTSAAEMVSI